MSDDDNVVGSSDIAVTGNSNIAVEFLLKWDSDGPWALSAIEINTRKIESKVFDKKEQILPWIEFWNGKRNLYFMANRPKAGLKRKAHKEDVAFANGFHVDVDPEKPAEGVDATTWLAQEQARIAELFSRFTPRPTVIIYSGGGYQGFWRSKDIVELDSPETIERVEKVNRLFEKKLGGDHCFNIDRIMRLPGTVNIPDDKKTALGRTRVVAEIVSADWSLGYSLDDFRVAAEEQATEQEKKKPGKAAAKPEASAATPRLPRRDPPDWTRRVIEHGPDMEGPRSYGGDRSKAAYAICCALIRAGWSNEEIAVCLLDRANKISEHVYAQSGPQKYALRQAERAREKVGVEFERNEEGKVLITQFNIRLALSILEVFLSYDLFARTRMIEGPNGQPLRQLADDDVVDLWLAVDDQFSFRPPKDFFFDVVHHEAGNAPFHPVHDYLDALQWDGKPRLNKWLVVYGGADDNEYTNAVGALMLLAAVRRVRQPGCKFDEMVVLESEQGKNKSTALNILAVRNEWFTDSLPLDADNREIIEQLSGKWIVEAAELKGMKRSDIEHMKGFLSSTTDRARVAYGRNPVNVPRQCIFCATTNSENYLIDPTGNRRYWPIKVNKFDLDKLRADLNQLWAEAATREAAGESIRLDPSLYAAAELEQDRRVVEDPWLNDLENAFLDNGTPVGRVLVDQVWQILIIPGVKMQDYSARIGNCMKRLGWERKKFNYKNRKRWFYAKGTDEEQRMLINIERTSIGLRIEYDTKAAAFDLDDIPTENSEDLPF